ncbi:MAG TPA: glucose 1-dehydrogenase [Thermoanaerobaculia bacterium]|nr:glucose 1-dehydrogenase [Thermoanaerobaculia bacterium]
MHLQNRTAIVTGAASGIGRAVALAYARAGANVIVSDIDEKGGQETIRLIGDAKAIFVRADTSKPEDHEALVKAAAGQFGALHIACNNAGIGGEVSEVANTSINGWRRVIEINLSGVFYAMRAQIPRMLEAGGGAIVNMASIFGQAAHEGSAGYVAAKHGVIGLTKSAALEYAARGIRINAVGPGYIDTPMLSRLPDERRKALGALHPIGRLGRPEEVAELVRWLCSDSASFITGAYYPIDGGYLARGGA